MQVPPRFLGAPRTTEMESDPTEPELLGSRFSGPKLEWMAPSKDAIRVTIMGLVRV